MVSIIDRNMVRGILATSIPYGPSVREKGGGFAADRSEAKAACTVSQNDDWRRASCSDEAGLGTRVGLWRGRALGRLTRISGKWPGIPFL
jgi:hypothetical protein